jgi:GPH family glycoside/pentoside/hexuronide:cation symporter
MCVFIRKNSLFHAYKGLMLKLKRFFLFSGYLNKYWIYDNLKNIEMDQAQLKLSFKEKLGYSLGDTASHFVWDMVGFWLLFFYTDVYGISAAAAGVIMLIARFWDMAIDPVIGIVSDRTNTRWGKFRPYILFGAVPYAILAILTFTTPNFGETGKIIYAGTTYVLLMTAYAAINLP